MAASSPIPALAPVIRTVFPEKEGEVSAGGANLRLRILRRTESDRVFSTTVSAMLNGLPAAWYRGSIQEQAMVQYGDRGQWVEHKGLHE